MPQGNPVRLFHSPEQDERTEDFKPSSFACQTTTKCHFSSEDFLSASNGCQKSCVGLSEHLTSVRRDGPSKRLQCREALQSAEKTAVEYRNCGLAAFLTFVARITSKTRKLRAEIL
jgi:hypothetical protein